MADASMRCSFSKHTKRDTIMKRLNSLAAGQSATIKSIDPEISAAPRLAALGLLPGVVVTVQQVAPLGDPFTISFGANRISLRRAEASALTIA